MELNKLRDRIHQCAVEHGWHEEKRSNNHWLCMVISELMEAVEADRKQRHADFEKFNKAYNSLIFETLIDRAFINAFDGYIKDTVEDELADACIRLLDFAGELTYDLDNFDYECSDTDDYSELTFTEAIFNITRYISISWEIPVLLNEIFAFCKVCDIDIMKHIEYKMKYNRLRPYKHGNKTY